MNMLEEVLLCVSRALLLTYAVLVGLGVVLLVAGLRWRTQSAGKVDTEGFKVSLPAKIIVGAIGLAFFLAPLWYHWVDDFLRVGLVQPSHALRNVQRGDTLSDLRNVVQQGSRTTIVLGPAAANLPVSGDFEGACASDLMMQVCRRYADQLTCEFSWWDNELRISQKK